jgi:hypothetical protein
LNTKEPTSIYDLLFIFSILDISAACGLYIIYFVFKEFGDDFRGRGIHPECRIIYTFFGVFIIVGVGASFYFFSRLPPYILRDSTLFFLSLASFPMLAWGIKKLSSLSPSLGETLLCVADGDSPSVDGDAANALTFFITNLTVSVMWYWLRYNPEGTINPSWTGVFG